MSTPKGIITKNNTTVTEWNLSSPITTYFGHLSGVGTYILTESSLGESESAWMKARDESTMTKKDNIREHVAATKTCRRLGSSQSHFILIASWTSAAE